MGTDRRAGPRLADGAASDCWRVSLAIRVAMAVAILSIGPIALISTAMQDFPISDPLTMIAIYSTLWWFGTIRPAIWLSPDELVVRNPLRTHRIARENVASARRGSFGVVISRRAGRPCVALVLPICADRAVGQITDWAQTPPSGSRGEASESPYAQTQRGWTRRRVVDIVAGVVLAFAYIIPALLLAWPGNSLRLWPLAGLVALLATVPFGITQLQEFRRDR